MKFTEREKDRIGLVIYYDLKERIMVYPQITAEDWVADMLSILRKVGYTEQADSLAESWKYFKEGE